MYYFEPSQQQQQVKQLPKKEQEKTQALIYFEEFEQLEERQPCEKRDGKADSEERHPEQKRGDDADSFPPLTHESEPLEEHPVEYQEEPRMVSVGNAEEYNPPNRQLPEEDYEQPKTPKQLSVRLIEFLLKREDVRPLLYTPIPHPTKFQFKVLRKKNLLGSTYGCVILWSQADRLIMVAKKESITSKTLFAVTAENFYQMDRTSIPAGKISRNGDIYDFTDDGTFVLGNQPITRRMGAARITKSLFSKDITMLTPLVENGQVRPIEANSLSNLFELNSMSTFSSRFLEYQGLNHQHPKARAIQSKLRFISSPNNLVLQRQVGSTSDIKIILGKSGDNEFKMGVSDGLSPFQAFCMVVSWLDC